MADSMPRDILARLTAQDAKVAVLEGKLARVEGPVRRQRLVRRSPTLLVAFLAALAPLALLTTTAFTDLTGGVHDANIEAIYNAGVTTGCVPNYVPFGYDGGTILAP